VARPQAASTRAVISHAHSDHVADHPLAYATPATRRLVTHRRRKPSAGTVEGCPLRPSRSPRPMRLTFYPAGHVIGSAQTLVETDFRAHPLYGRLHVFTPKRTIRDVNRSIGHRIVLPSARRTWFPGSSHGGS